MKRQLFFFNVFLLSTSFLLPSISFPAWQVTRPEASMPREPFFQAGLVPPPPGPRRIGPTSYMARGFPNVYSHLGRPAPLYCMTISGSLKENLERIMSRYRWRVIWKSPYDYNFDGRVTGSSLPNVVQKLLDPFPLQAVMYMSNRTLTVIPRSRTGY